MKEFDIISIGGGSGVATMNRAGELELGLPSLKKNNWVAPVSTEDVPKKLWYGAQIAEAIRDYGPDYGFT